MVTSEWLGRWIDIWATAGAGSKPDSAQRLPNSTSGVDFDVGGLCTAKKKRQFQLLETAVVIPLTLWTWPGSLLWSPPFLGGSVIKWLSLLLAGEPSKTRQSLAAKKIVNLFCSRLKETVSLVNGNFAPKYLRYRLPWRALKLTVRAKSHCQQFSTMSKSPHDWLNQCSKRSTLQPMSTWVSKHMRAYSLVRSGESLGGLGLWGQQRVSVALTNGDSQTTLHGPTSWNGNGKFK